MSGALLQLSALSSQDIYLTSDPEVTLFKKAYLRYTNFSTETVQVAFDGGILQFGENYTTTATLNNAGDLISKIVLVVNLAPKTTTSKWGYVNRVGHTMIQEVIFRVGQSDIENFNYDWIDIYQHIIKDKSQENNYNKIIGDVPSLKKIDNDHPSYKLFIPLEFFNTKATTSAFPVCALKKDLNVQISVKLKDAMNIINYYGETEPSLEELPTIQSSYLLVDYVFLERDEKKLFTENNHEYLIETVESMEDIVSANESKYNLTFDKPTKFLAWYTILDRYNQRNQFMSWAHDNDWEKARNNFAKLVWLITREGLNASDSNNPYIVFNDTFVNIGQVPAMITGGNNMFEKLASKVNAIILFAENINGEIRAKATVDNIVLITNNITYEDMSTTNAEFREDINTTEQQLNFINIHTYSILEDLNYGNFINRTDNPIVDSSFQLNGKNRFQERDGFFYNYLQPYYYFKNSPPDGVNLYTFSLHPDQTQPSGTLNLGYINSKDLLIKIGKYNSQDNEYFTTFFKNGKMRIFACGYNILKIFDKNVALSY